MLVQGQSQRRAARRPGRIRALLFSAIALAAPDVYAQVWDGGHASSDDWTFGLNWNPNGTPLNNGTADIVMGGIVRLTPNVNGSQDINSLKFNSSAGAFVIGGSPLIVRSGGIDNSSFNLQTLNNNVFPRGSQTWSAFSAPMVFNALIESSVGTPTLTVDGAFNTTFNGEVADNGTILSLTKSGTATLTLAGPTANSFEGVTIVNAGTLRLNKSAANGAIPRNLNMGDGVNTPLVILDAPEQVWDSALVSISTGATFHLNGFNETIGLCFMGAGGNLVGGGGTLILNGGVATGISTFAGSNPATFTSNINLGGATERIFNIQNGLASSDAIIDGVISNGSFLKNNAGALALVGSSSNTYTGTTRVTAGMLILQKNASGIVAVPGNVSIGDGSGVDTLRILQSEQIANTSTLNLDSSGVVELFTFTETIGSLNTTGGQITGAGGTLILAGNLTSFASAATATIGPQVNLGGGTRTFTIADGAPDIDITLSGGIENGNLIKTGAGTLALSGPSSRTGTTSIQDGTVLVQNGTALGTGNVSLPNSTSVLEVAAVAITPNIAISGGATLRGTGDAQASGTITIPAGNTATLQTGTSFTDKLTLGNLIGGGGSSTITVNGDGKVFLSAGSTVDADWIISGGRLVVAGSDPLDNPARTVTLSGTLETFTNVTIAHTVIPNGGSLSTQGATPTMTLSTALAANAAALNISGVGTVVLQAPSGRTGDTFISAGVLRLENATAMGTNGTGLLHIAGSSTLEVGNVTIDKPMRLAVDSATLRGTGASAVSNGVVTIDSGVDARFATVAPTDVLTLGNATNDLTGGSSSSTITVLGPGKVKLTQMSDYTGGWIVSSGTLEISANNNLGAGTNSVTLFLGTLVYLSGGNPMRSFFTNGGGINNSSASVLNLTGSITSAANGGFTKLGTGVLTITGPQTHATGSTIAIAAGTLNLNSDAGTPTARNLSINANAGALNMGVTQHLNALNIFSGVTATLNALGTNVIQTNTISVAGTGRLDLKDNKLIVRTTATGTAIGSVYNGVTGMIQSGRNGSILPLWDGGGIVTSQSTATGGNLHSIGVARASDVRPATATATALWAGQTITGTDTLVMYTYGGDATLDGTINIDDYVKIDQGIAAGFKGWSNGDFNYDGKVNIDDYTTVIDSNIGTQGPPFGTSSFEPAATVAVPEPTALLLLTPLFGLRTRRRRQPLPVLM